MCKNYGTCIILRRYRWFTNKTFNIAFITCKGIENYLFSGYQCLNQWAMQSFLQIFLSNSMLKFIVTHAKHVSLNSCYTSSRGPRTPSKGWQVLVVRFESLKWNWEVGEVNSQHRYWCPYVLLLLPIKIITSTHVDWHLSVIFQIGISG